MDMFIKRKTERRKLFEKRGSRPVNVPLRARLPRG
jgi:hypothetical protein